MRTCFLVLANTSSEESSRLALSSLINLNSHDPDADIFLIDSAVNQCEGVDKLDFVKYISLEQLNSNVAAVARSHFSKTHRDCQSLLEFLRHYKKELEEQYDFVTKIDSDRLLDSSFGREFIPANRNKFILKIPSALDYEHLFPSFKSVVPDDFVIGGKLWGFNHILQSWGIEKNDVMQLMFKLMCQQTETTSSKYWAMDIGYFLYNFLFKFKLLEDVIVADCNLYGFGNGGLFLE